MSSPFYLKEFQISDLSEVQSAGATKIIGSDSTGLETNAVNADSSGNLNTINPSDGPVTAGTVATKSSLAGGQFNTTLPTLTNTQQAAVQLDSNGRILTSNSLTDGTKSSYSASINGLIIAAAATDIFTITGSASKTIRIININISGTQSTASYEDILLIKRSTANSAGTSTTRTNIPHDSTNAAATAIVRAYTINPTLGTAVGTMKTKKMVITAAATGGSFVGALNILSMKFGIGPSQAIVLRGTSEVLAINLNAQTLIGSSFDIDIEWSEE